uniref:Calcium-activated chloride channel N-terminal domain-containing protein n=1 Tax=Erpetoichthys calabaricus TaxID=27687 RepID=A0A8C4SPP2_ERPCA
NKLRGPLILKFLFTVSLCLLSGTKSLKVELENNGYKNLVIAINPKVPENTNIITRIEVIPFYFY